MGYMSNPTEMSDDELASWMRSFNDQPPTMDSMVEHGWAMRVLGEHEARKNAPKISTDRLHYVSQLNEWAVEASDLADLPIRDRVVLVSSKTGLEVPFVCVGTAVEPREGELLWHEFRPVHEPAGKSYGTLKVFND